VTMRCNIRSPWRPERDDRSSSLRIMPRRFADVLGSGPVPLRSDRSRRVGIISSSENRQSVGTASRPPDGDRAKACA